MNKILKAVVPALLAVSFLAGCASLGDREGAFGKVAIQYGTMKLIEQSEGVTAQGVIAHVERVRTLLDTSEEVSLGDLRTEILSRLDTDRLSPADLLLLSALLDEVEVSLDVQVDVLGDEDREQVGVVLDWVVAAARLSS